MAKPKSALTQILLALVPYSRQNILLSFSPNRFFNELEKSTGYSQRTLQKAYRRGQQRGLISGSAKPKVSPAGFKVIRPYTAVKLGDQTVLMVIFDIPEQSYATRQKLRETLKSWDFIQIQKSVWASDMDYRESLLEVISELGIGRHVQVFEAYKLFPIR